MENIEFNIENGVAWIRLNRPDVLNSFNFTMARSVQNALDECANNKIVRAVVLTGNGRGFCAGQDLAEATAPDGPTIGSVVEQTYNPIINKIRNIEKPIICAVNGVAAGAGANVAIACDITIAATNAKFVQAFSNIGLIPDCGGTFFLPRLIGLQRATAQMLLADKITADDAKAMGMIYDVAEPDELIATATRMAETLAQRPTRGFGLTKKALNLSLQNSLEQQLEVEKQLQEQAGSTFDFKEGVTAFLEKRQPNYKGE